MVKWSETYWIAVAVNCYDVSVRINATENINNIFSIKNDINHLIVEDVGPNMDYL